MFGGGGGGGMVAALLCMWPVNEESTVVVDLDPLP